MVSGIGNITKRIGKTYLPKTYAVGREKIREYAQAVGEHEPLYLDLDAARAAGYADLVAPPMFAVLYAGVAVMPTLDDPELEVDFAHLVHGAQKFRWDGPLVIAGDEITTTATVNDVSERAGLRFYTMGSHSVNQRGETVCDGVWSFIVREEEV